jgi:glutamyl-tRNA reductase
MLVGTGDMAELAAKHLVATGIKDLIIASRKLESAEVLAYRLKGRPIRIEEIYYFLTALSG